MTWNDLATATNTMYIMLSLMAVAISIMYLGHQIGKKNQSQKLKK